MCNTITDIYKYGLSQPRRAVPIVEVYHYSITNPML